MVSLQSFHLKRKLRRRCREDRGRSSSCPSYRAATRAKQKDSGKARGVEISTTRRTPTRKFPVLMFLAVYLVSSIDKMDGSSTIMPVLEHPPLLLSIGIKKVSYYFRSYVFACMHALSNIERK